MRVGISGVSYNFHEETVIDPPSRKVEEPPYPAMNIFCQFLAIGSWGAKIKTLDCTIKKGLATLASILFVKYGRNDENRTRDLLVPNQAHYRLCYVPMRCYRTGKYTTTKIRNQRETIGRFRPFLPRLPLLLNQLCSFPRERFSYANLPWM